VFGTPIGEDPVTGELVRRQSGVDKGKILQSYQSSRGGIIVFDDGDIEEELQTERTAYCALEEMPEVGEEDDLDGDSDSDDEPSSAQPPKKRKSWGEEDDSDHEMSDDERPRQRRRSNSVCIAR
jgi:cell division control protein 45